MYMKHCSGGTVNLSIHCTLEIRRESAAPLYHPMKHVVFSRQPPVRWWTDVGWGQMKMLPCVPVHESALTTNGQVENVGSEVYLNGGSFC